MSVQYFNGQVAQPTYIIGQNLKDSFSGTVTVTKEYDNDMHGFAIINDGAANLTFTIGTLTVTVKTGETFDEQFDPFTEVTITATAAFRAIVRG